MHNQPQTDTFTHKHGQTNTDITIHIPSNTHTHTHSIGWAISHQETVQCKLREANVEGDMKAWQLGY